MAIASFAALLDGIRVATAKISIVDPLSEDGNIMCVLNDLEGKVINFITRVMGLRHTVHFYICLQKNSMWQLGY
jgi:hypothetical protein